MGHVLLGHGGMDADPAITAPGMEKVAIPEGTRLQIYTDVFQPLGRGEGEPDVWERLQAPWPPLDSRHVTYNLTLGNAGKLWKGEPADHPRFAGHTVLLPGRDGVPDPVRMCTGTPDTCPTDPRQVAEGARHTCDGVLGSYQGDLFWLACDSVAGAAAEEEPVADASPAGAADASPAGGPPFTQPGDDEMEWTPDEADQREIARINGAQTGRAADGSVLPYVLGGFAFLIGSGHLERYELYALLQDEEVFEGEVTVRTADAGRLDRLEVSGVPPHKQDIVRAAASLFTPAPVLFT